MIGRRTFLAVTGAVLLATCADSSPIPRRHAAPPSKALIPGVPYLGFAEAARIPCRDKDITNPSMTASLGMLLQHRGMSLKILEEKDPDSVPVKLVVDGNLEGIKAQVARNVPVYVFQAITPFAHFVNPPVAMMLTFSDSKLLKEIDAADLSTSILGRMAPYETFLKIQKELKMETLWHVVREVVYAASRVVIGYDDERKVVILHDPTYGPAFEVSYDDFDALWKPCGRSFSYIEPEPGSAPPAPTSTYRERTAGERAAQCFLYGYASSCLGNITQADEWLTRGLEIPGVDKGYQHLLLLEQASLRHHQNRFDEAIEAAQRANELTGNNPLTWLVLAHVYQDRRQKGDDSRAKDAQKKAEGLQKNRKAFEALGRFLPNHFWIPLVAPVRGWAGKE